MLLGGKIVQANDLYTLWEHVNIEKYCDCNLANRKGIRVVPVLFLFTTFTVVYTHKSYKFKGESTKLLNTIN